MTQRTQNWTDWNSMPERKLILFSLPSNGESGKQEIILEYIKLELFKLIEAKIQTCSPWSLCAGNFSSEESLLDHNPSAFGRRLLFLLQIHWL